LFLINESERRYVSSSRETLPSAATIVCSPVPEVFFMKEKLCSRKVVAPVEQLILEAGGWQQKEKK
jgi:hypothetical protein